MGLTRKMAQGRSLGALTTTFLLVVLGALLLAAAAQAAARPGKPTARSPKGAIATTRPTFTWSKAPRATRYEVRVYKGGKLLVKKTGLARRSWRSGKVLTGGVSYAWKVRGRKAGVNGAWSRSLKFKVASAAKAITAFSFQGLSPPVIGTITEADHTIALTVPFGTDVGGLVATFTTTGASVRVGGAPQMSGTTANDFTGPVTYEVTAANASTQDYTVTVTVAPLAIGDTYQGGKVAYILQPGDPGYDAGETRGLIAATADQSAGIPWWNGVFTVTGVTATELGTGFANTNAIIAAQGATSTAYAAGLARAYDGGGHSDWYLPSKDELQKLYLSRDAIGGFGSAAYWSSSEIGSTSAWSQTLDSGDRWEDSKPAANAVRAVRTFPAGPAKAITAFSFQGLSPAVTGAITEADHTIALTVPFGTDVGGLVATFTTTGAAVKVDATPQVSGTTPNDFTSPVTYTAVAADASTQDYTVTVTVTATAAKAITAFSFQGLGSPVTGAISEADHTIALTVPFKTDVTALVATFTTTGEALAVGATPQVSGETQNDFSKPLTYTVTAADTSTQDYEVTVTVAAETDKVITSFGFQGLSPEVIGAVKEADHTIALAVPFGTDVSALVATFTTSGTSVRIGATSQASGKTQNDFGKPLTYTVTAADASTQDYVVTVIVAPAIGALYEGGKVAYILQSGDPGYVVGEVHGLIAAVADQSTNLQWYNGTDMLTGATATAIGTGMANTEAIIAAQGPTATDYAAGLARAYAGGGHADWYLPSRDELYQLWVNRVAIGGFVEDYSYWSSSEVNAQLALFQAFWGSGSWLETDKENTCHVRAVRSF